MKTISLEEAKKLATPGPLEVRTGKAGHACLYVEGTVFDVAVGMKPADAFLFKHLWNTHDELVEALEDLAFDAGRVERKFSEGRDWAEWRDLRDKLNALKPLLARAKTVEIF